MKDVSDHHHGRKKIGVKPLLLNIGSNSLVDVLIEKQKMVNNYNSFPIPCLTVILFTGAIFLNIQNDTSIANHASNNMHDVYTGFRDRHGSAQQMHGR